MLTLQPLLAFGTLAAWLALAGGACAADGAAPRGRAAPPSFEGLDTCPNGGFILPGSKTCVRLGGAVRAEAAVGTRMPSGADTRRALVHLGTSARLDMDVRTPTELGPVRVFTSVRVRPGDPPGR